ncbi:MAG: metal-binding protein [Cyclobacteriaceae bacterium]|nr:MAG: metal-binding protein [Cyclobacteriaceae bacterium]
MWLQTSLTQSEILSKIKKGEIAFAGNRNLKIYGLLNCASGKRMKIQNRVFFDSGTEALENGYRPCKKCMYKN